MGCGIDHTCKSRPKAACKGFKSKPILLDLGFLEFDMLFGNRIIFALRDLVGHRARIFLGHVEKARIGGRKQLDLDCCGFSHGGNPRFNVNAALAAKIRVDQSSGRVRRHPSDNALDVKKSRLRKYAVGRAFYWLFMLFCPKRRT